MVALAAQEINRRWPHRASRGDQTAGSADLRYCRTPQGRISMSAPPVFVATHIGKRFGHHRVLREIDFSIEPGEYVLLLGNNGAGKTTLLRILTSLMRPSEGEMRFRGSPYRAVGTELRGAIGVIAHDSQLYGDLTARENLHLFGSLYGVADVTAKIAPALERVRLDHVPGIPVRNFSSGMLKRLAIARLLLYRPAALLLDEPYSGLDQVSLELLDGYLEEFKRDGGTMVLTTHQFTQGVRHADRILILHQGRLVYNRPETGITAARCAELLHRYASGRPSADKPSRATDRE